jgi:CRP-like cAMP-binding protein
MAATDNTSNRFLEVLSEQDRTQLQRSAQTVTIHAGQVLHAPGEDHDYVLLPYSSIIGLKAPFPPHGLIETAIIGREGVVGALSAMSGRAPLYGAHALVSGQIARISKKIFSDMLFSSPQMRELVARFECSLLTQVQQGACCAAIHPVEARLCRWLLQIQDRSPNGSRLAFTQDLIAQSLGVRRTTITLAAGRLQEAAAIRWRRGQVDIADRCFLEQHVCECYAAMNDCLDMQDGGQRYTPHHQSGEPPGAANFRLRA